MRLAEHGEARDLSLVDCSDAEKVLAELARAGANEAALAARRQSGRVLGFGDIRNDLIPYIAAKCEALRI
jgi:hypothetical protein